MNRKPRSRGASGRPSRPTTRSAAAIVAAAALALLAAACGSPSAAPRSGSANASGTGTASPSAVAYSQCMRSHGVPNFPDPPSGGGIAKGGAQELGVSNSTYQAALQACQSMIPAAGGSTQQEEQQCFVASDCSPAVVQHLLALMRKFSRCMRSHGEPDFPDPSTNAQGQPLFDVSAEGISDADTHSPQFISKLDECQRQVGNFPYTFG
jgi:hypothetical protein